MIATPRSGRRADCLARARGWVAPADGCGQQGGDVYAAVHTPYGTRLLIADVRGKGDSAADGARALLAAFTDAAGGAASLSVLAEALEDAMLRHAAHHHDATVATENFATAVLGELDGTGRVLRLRNHGHPAPLLLRSGTVSVLEPARRGLPLGLPPEWRDLARSRQAGASTVEIPARSTLLFLTDGVTEARDADGVFYDPVARLTGAHPPEPAELLAFLGADVARHTASGNHRPGAAADDMALLALRCGDHRPTGTDRHGAAGPRTATRGRQAAGRNSGATGR